MLFPTIEFAIFFPIVLGLSWLLMPRQPLWKPFIVVASYVFYAAADPRFCLLLGRDHGRQPGRGRPHPPRGRRAPRASGSAAAAVALDLLVLGVFKYYAFFVTDVGDVLDAIGLGMPLPLLTVVLPIGVSFFTFQAITYVVDVKRGDAEPASLIDAADLPELLPAPGRRADRPRERVPAAAAARRATRNRVAVGAGLPLIALGLVKKVVIADTLAREIVDPVFGVPEAYFAPDAILATLAYAAQIYCDFSGYTDIAIGLALLLGFIFPQNFNSPYRATGFRDFWRRWHMTLSRFLRDYLYIPLGGSRGEPRWFTYRNLMITMVLGGLWHGAAWTFVLWGAFHGAMLCTEHALDGRIGRRTPVWLRWLGTFNPVCFGWILFRSPDLDVFWTFLGRLVDWGPATLWTVPVVLDGRWS